MIIVQLGNPSPKDSFPQSGDEGYPCECCGRTDIRHALVEGPEITTWSVQEAPREDPGHYSLLDCVKSICEPDGAWQNHTWVDNPKPLWVWSNKDALQTLLVEHFDCPVGPPAKFKTATDIRNETLEAPQLEGEVTDGPH